MKIVMDIVGGGLVMTLIAYISFASIQSSKEAELELDTKITSLHVEITPEMPTLKAGEEVVYRAVIRDQRNRPMNLYDVKINWSLGSPSHGLLTSISDRRATFRSSETSIGNEVIHVTATYTPPRFSEYEPEPKSLVAADTAGCIVTK
jgi:hypothetical protein